MRVRWKPVAVHAALGVIAVLTLAPILWMVSVSFMSPGEAAVSPPPLLPKEATLHNYRQLLAQAGMGRAFANSALLATCAAVLSLAFNVSAGYAFAKLRFAGRERIYRGLLGALVIPAQVVMIPVFLLLKSAGLVNTYAGVLLPAMANVSGIFLVRQYAVSVPDSLLEAARIDGASEGRLFWSIVLPSLSPILVTLAVLSFLGSWNDFLWPLIVLADDRLYTLPVALASLTREHVPDSELMMAGSVITVLPVLALFLLLQRYYIRGLLAGSVKG
ncbi:MAG TPA: carbohydrate ABC transporter permease [Myxococcaceae bacterium]|jgi:multiple sugar transport system permease protein